MERIWRIIGERWKRRNDFYLALFYPCHLSYFTFIQSIHRSTDKLPIMIHWLLSEIFRKFLWLIIIETPYPLPNSPKSPLPYPLNNLKFLQSNKNSSLPRIKRPISAWWPPTIIAFSFQQAFPSRGCCARRVLNFGPWLAWPSLISFFWACCFRNRPQSRPFRKLI